LDVTKSSYPLLARIYTGLIIDSFHIGRCRGSANLAARYEHSGQQEQCRQLEKASGTGVHIFLLSKNRNTDPLANTIQRIPCQFNPPPPRQGRPPKSCRLRRSAVHEPSALDIPHTCPGGRCQGGTAVYLPEPESGGLCFILPQINHPTTRIIRM